MRPLATARNVIEAVRELREDWGFEVRQADAIGVAAARIAEESTDRIADRLALRVYGALAVCTGLIIGTIAVAITLILWASG